MYVSAISFLVLFLSVDICCLQAKTCPECFFIISSQGGAIQLRFQPHHGKYLAVVSEKMISILDAKTLHIYRSDLQVDNQ